MKRRTHCTENLVWKIKWTWTLKTFGVLSHAVEDSCGFLPVSVRGWVWCGFLCWCNSGCAKRIFVQGPDPVHPILIPKNHLLLKSFWVFEKNPKNWWIVVALAEMSRCSCSNNRGCLTFSKISLLWFGFLKISVFEICGLVEPSGVGLTLNSLTLLADRFEEKWQGILDKSAGLCKRTGGPLLCCGSSLLCPQMRSV